MQRNSTLSSVIILAAATVLLAGCQFAGFRDDPQESAEQGDRPLNGRQVADVQLSLARSLERRGEIEPALNAYRQAVEKDPKRATGYWRMAVLHDRQGKVAESEALYRQALKLDAKNPDLLSDYGYSLYLQRRWVESEEKLRQAIAIKPRHPRAHNNLGLVLAQAERSTEALAEFGKAGCDAAQARSNLAFVMTLDHRWDEARENYELALDANPDSDTAKSGLASLEALTAKAANNNGSVVLTNHEEPVDAGSTPTTRKRVTTAMAVDGERPGRASVSTMRQNE
jgi:Tfp pilus assembly protein PilF